MKNTQSWVDEEERMDLKGVQRGGDCDKNMLYETFRDF